MRSREGARSRVELLRRFRRGALRLTGSRRRSSDVLLRDCCVPVCPRAEGAAALQGRREPASSAINCANSSAKLHSCLADQLRHRWQVLAGAPPRAGAGGAGSRPPLSGTLAVALATESVGPAARRPGHSRPRPRLLPAGAREERVSAHIATQVGVFDRDGGDARGFYRDKPTDRAVRSRRRPARPTRSAGIDAPSRIVLRREQYGATRRARMTPGRSGATRRRASRTASRRRWPGGSSPSSRGMPASSPGITAAASVRSRAPGHPRRRARVDRPRSRRSTIPRGQRRRSGCRSTRPIPSAAGGSSPATLTAALGRR